MKDSYRKRLPDDISRVLLLRIFGAHAENENVTYRRRHIKICSAVGAGLLAWSIGEAFYYSSWDAFIHFLPWCFYYLIFVASLFPVFRGFGQLFIRMAGPLDQILTDHGRAAYQRWAPRALLTAPQLAAGVFIAIVSPVAVAIVRGIAGPDTRVLVLPPSYAIVSMAGFFCGCAAYWAIGAALFVRMITRPRHLKLYPILPARTPGIEELSQITVTGFVASAIYSVVLLFPFIYWTYDFDLSGVGASGNRTTFFAVKVILILICSIVTLAIGLIPQIHISLAIQRVRRTRMLALLRRLSVNSRVWRGEGDERLHDLFSSVANSPISTLGGGNIVEISVGVIAALLPLVVTVILH